MDVLQAMPAVLSLDEVERLILYLVSDLAGRWRKSGVALAQDNDESLIECGTGLKR